MESHASSYLEMNDKTSPMESKQNDMTSRPPSPKEKFIMIRVFLLAIAALKLQLL